MYVYAWKLYVYFSRVVVPCISSAHLTVVAYLQYRQFPHHHSQSQKLYALDYFNAMPQSSTIHADSRLPLSYSVILHAHDSAIWNYHRIYVYVNGQVTANYL